MTARTDSARIELLQDAGVLPAFLGFESLTSDQLAVAAQALEGFLGAGEDGEALRPVYDVLQERLAEVLDLEEGVRHAVTILEIAGGFWQSECKCGAVAMTLFRQQRSASMWGRSHVARAHV
jgi:hypothetical protein